MATTKHTCNDGNGPYFGKKTAGCPRCDELTAGAEPVRWDTSRRDLEDRLEAERQAHDCRQRRCGPVCTAFQW